MTALRNYLSPDIRKHDRRIGLFWKQHHKSTTVWRRVCREDDGEPFEEKPLPEEFWAKPEPSSFGPYYKELMLAYVRIDNVHVEFVYDHHDHGKDDDHEHSIALSSSMSVPKPISIGWGDTIADVAERAFSMISDGDAVHKDHDDETFIEQMRANMVSGTVLALVMPCSRVLKSASLILQDCCSSSSSSTSKVIGSDNTLRLQFRCVDKHMFMVNIRTLTGKVFFVLVFFFKPIFFFDDYIFFCVMNRRYICQFFGT